MPESNVWLVGFGLMLCTQIPRAIPYVPLIPHAGTVLNHHDIESALVQRRASHERNFLWRAFWRRESANLLVAERQWCPTFDANLVVSEDEGHLVKSSCGDSAICVVPNGVDVSVFYSAT